MRMRIGLAVASVAALSLLAFAFAGVLASPRAVFPAEEPGLVAVARPFGLPSTESRLFRLAGTVRTVEGAALAGALACDHPSFEAATICGRSREDGSFALAVPAGFHKLEVLAPPGSAYLGTWFEARDRPRNAELLDLRTGDRTELDVRLERGHRVSGRVTTLAAAPIPDAQACAGPTQTPAEWVCVRTDVDGRYTAVVAPGDYQLFFVPPEDTRLVPRWWRNGDQVLAAEVLSVRADLAGIDMRIPEGNLLSGRVLATSGKPIEHALVCVDTRFPTGRICRPTNKAGEYSVAVRRGTFVVQFVPSPLEGVVTEWHGDTPDPREARDVFVGGDVRLDAALRSGKLAWGFVRDAEGRPLQSSFVNAYDADDGSFVNGGATGSSGDYAFVLPPGRFFLRAYPPFGTAYVSAYYGGETPRVFEVREEDDDVTANLLLAQYDDLAR